MRNNLVVYGVPEATSAGTEDCTKVVADVTQTLFEIREEIKLDFAYRSANRESVNGNRLRPIIVDF
ncbi:hypothetical protein DPMN_110128 [Dreissena polymorpha]|uniref:Uncharacterized protein n=1 Tax=Dreissena polymorpha TaxID=45954 RepID=A0A9D4KBK3_DREPO|nr:hypothetical protein DPMN_110128 [Dreissena polymorpha]